MGQRILFGYAGAILLPLLLLPIAIIYTMGGHSLMFITVFGSPLGLLVGLIISDKKRHLTPYAILLRTVIAFVAAIAWIALVASVKIVPFFVSQEWVLIPFGGPLVAAPVSEFFLWAKAI